jgi:hypothetical protein
MLHRDRNLGFAASLVLASTVALVPQTRAQTPTAAYVYVQVGGAAGAVYGYSASSSGALTAISGSPFKPGTQIVGSNGSEFFTIGHTSLHSFAVGSNGAIGSQLSDIGITGYGGGSCAGTHDGDTSAVLDHTGKYIYVLLQNREVQSGDTCEAIESYIINSGGTFTYDGDTERTSLAPALVGLPSILGNETFAYSNNLSFGNSNDLIALKRESSGTLENSQFDETDPPLSGGSYTAYNPDADSTGSYLVVQLVPADQGGAPQLGSYTVDSQGNISSTNTSSDMPTSALNEPNSTFSPSDNLLAVYADATETDEPGHIEIYNFNGAAPLTLNTTLLNGTPIDQVAWDSSNHLYAISKAQNMLYVFTATSTSATEDASYSIGSPFSMVVVSQTPTSGGGSCSAPTSPGVNVCSPSNDATVTSPVQINAAATVSGGVYRFELWNGSTKLLSIDNGIMDQTLSLEPGSYKLTFDARNTSGTHEYAYRDITVQ